MHTMLQVDDEAMDLNKDLMSKLLELDDVDAVYADQQWPYLILYTFIHHKITQFTWVGKAYTCKSKVSFLSR